MLELNPDHAFELDKYRILDFYYLFPHLLGSITLPSKMIGRKKKFGKTASPYNRVPNPKGLIQQLRGLHFEIARSAAAKGLIEPADLDAERLVRTDVPLPEFLSVTIASDDGDHELAEMLAVDMAEIALNGPNGLKARTGLLEHRYDAI
jgi:hypothetical protein